MDFFSKIVKNVPSAPATGGEESSQPQGSGFDILNSAKVVAGAAQAHFSNQPVTTDNAEVAGATADLLGAASEYGKLDKTQGAGQYVDQAETYLRDYKTSHTTEPVKTELSAEETTETKSKSEVPLDGGSAVEEYGSEDKTDVLPSKITGEDTAGERDASYKSGEDKTDVVPSKFTSEDTAGETDASYKFGEDKTDVVPSKITSEDTAGETDASYKSGEDKTDFVPSKITNEDTAGETDASYKSGEDNIDVLPSKIAVEDPTEENETKPSASDTIGEEKEDNFPSKTSADAVDTTPAPDFYGTHTKTEGNIEENPSESAFSVKPIGEETSIKPDSKPAFDIEAEKPSFGGVVEDEANEESFSDKPFSGKTAAYSVSEEAEKTEDSPQQPSFAVTGDYIGDKIKDSAGVGRF